MLKKIHWIILIDLVLLVVLIAISLPQVPHTVTRSAVSIELIRTPQGRMTATPGGLGVGR